MFCMILSRKNIIHKQCYQKLINTVLINKKRFVRVPNHGQSTVYRVSQI